MPASIGQVSELVSEAWPFGVDDLSLDLAGAPLADEQVRLYQRVKEDGYHAFGLAATIAKRRFDVGHSWPHFQWTDDVTVPVVVPSVVMLQWDYWPTVEASEPDWRRFPSLPGRAMIYSTELGWTWDDIAPVRLWDLSPLPADDVDDVLEGVRRWWDSHLEPYFAYSDYFDGETKALCDQVGTPVTTHRHDYDAHGEFVVCQDSEAWANSYAETSLYFDHEIDMAIPVDLPLPSLRAHTYQWERLYHSSRAGLQAGLRCYPTEDRERILATERMCSPWSWL